MSTIDPFTFKQAKPILDYIRNKSSRGIIADEEERLLSFMSLYIPFHSHLVLETTFNEIKRMSVNKRIVGGNKRIRDINFLKYPPKEKVKSYGRCNLKEQSVLYGSISFFSTVSETRPEVGDLVTESTWRVKKPENTLKYCAIFMNQPKGGKIINPWAFELNEIFRKRLHISKLPFEEVIYFAQFVADEFSKDVKDNHFDYLISAYLSDVILNHYENGTIEAICYPGVRDNLSFENLVIKPKSFDDKYELVEVKDSICDFTPKESGVGYGFSGLATCHEFDFINNKILWGKTVNQTQDILSVFKTKYGLDLED